VQGECGAASAGKAVRESRRRNRSGKRSRTRSVAEQQRSAVFMQSGREALLSGDDDNASVLLAAAYTQDPRIRRSR